MNSEVLLKRIKQLLELEVEFDKMEMIITPTKYDPLKLQHKVLFLIMEKVENGSIPRFEITVNDLIKRQYKNEPR